MPIKQPIAMNLFFRPPLLLEQSTPLSPSFVLLSRIVMLVNSILFINSPNELDLLFLLLLFVTCLNIFPNLQLRALPCFVHLFCLKHLLRLVLISPPHRASSTNESIILQSFSGVVFIVFAPIFSASSIWDFNWQSSDWQYLGLHFPFWRLLRRKKINICHITDGQRK